MEGLGAELSDAEISGVWHFVLVDKVLEERKDVEVGDYGSVFGGDIAVDHLTSLVVHALVEGAVVPVLAG